MMSGSCLTIGLLNQLKSNASGLVFSVCAAGVMRAIQCSPLSRHLAGQIAGFVIASAYVAIIGAVAGKFTANRTV